jgi:hydrogenase maturation factor
MNLVTGHIAEIYIDGGITRSRVSVGETQHRVVMTLMMDARVGDTVLIDSGVAISKVTSVENRETNHVSGDSR